MSTSNISKICNDDASSKSNNGVCEVNDMLQNMNLANDEVNCEKVGSHITYSTLVESDVLIVARKVVII